MSVRFQKWITRQDLKNNPNVYYVFGDNMKRRGFGGQAKEMRGETNAIGLATKFSPGTNEFDYYNDDSLTAWSQQAADLKYIKTKLEEGHIVVFPTDGLGTGLSQLPKRAPKLYAQLYKVIEAWYEMEIPWEKPK